MSSLSQNSRPLLVLPDLAVEIGLNEAIVLNQVNYWLEKNKKTGNNLRDGRFWVYNSFPKWQEQFPWWSISTVKRIFSSLEEQGLLISGCYNRLKMDRTKWYTIDYEKLGRFFASGQNDPIESANTTRPIPETSPVEYREYKKYQRTISEEPSYDSLASKPNSIFASLTAQYGADRVRDALSIVNWYIDEVYPFNTGHPHPEEPKAKRMAFAQKILACSDETFVEADMIADAMNRAAEKANCDPTIYYVTTPKVLGYWLIKDEEIGYESVNGTEYAPVESLY